MAKQSIWIILSLALLITVAQGQDGAGDATSEEPSPQPDAETGSPQPEAETTPAAGGESGATEAQGESGATVDSAETTPANEPSNFPLTLPDGSNLEQLAKDQFQIAPNDPDAYRRILFNNKKINGIHVAQGKERGEAPNPYTIGEVLAYLYELAEWGPKGPPGGFTLVRKGQVIPGKKTGGPAKRSAGFKRGRLVFTKKNKPVL